MTATNHGLGGAFIAVVFAKYPAAALVLAPLSHFLLDSLPHFGFQKFNPKDKHFLYFLVGDALLAVGITLLLAVLWNEIWWLIILCAFLGASPDLMWYYYYYMRPNAKKDPVARFHSWIQWSQTPRGMVIEIVWFTSIFSILVYGAR